MPNADRPDNPDDWRALYPFASHWLNTPLGRMHYVDEGPNSKATQALLFVHGNPTWSFHWRNLIQAYRPDLRCVAVDHMGCGLSDKPTKLLTLDDHIANLSRLVAHLGLENVTLVAQDWGGSIGLGAMLHAPHRLDRIILFNTGAFPPPYIPWRIRACRWPVVGQLAVQGGNVFSRAALRMTLARPHALTPAVAAGYLAPYDSWGNRRAVFGFVKDIPRSPHEPTWKTLAEIESKLPSLADRPSLLIWGMRDWCFRADCLKHFVDAWPQAEVHRLDNVGHWVVEDAPDESFAITRQFLASRSQRLPPTRSDA